MKILLAALTMLFSLAIILLAGFQLARLFMVKFAEIVVETWRSPWLPSSH